MAILAYLVLSILLASLHIVSALNAGNYVITSAAFPNQRVVGTDDQNEGHPLIALQVRLCGIVRLSYG